MSGLLNNSTMTFSTTCGTSLPSTHRQKRILVSQPLTVSHTIPPPQQQTRNPCCNATTTMAQKTKNRGGGRRSRKFTVSAQSTFLIVAGFVLVYVSLVSRQLNVVVVDIADVQVPVDVSSGSTSTDGLISSSSSSSSKTADNHNNDNNKFSNRTTKPPLRNYIQGKNITGDVNWLLSFSIVAFPKCGTSSLMAYLRNQTESIYMFDDERCELGWKQEVNLVWHLHANYRPGIQMGIKCPRDLEVDIAMENYRRYFPNTKFIIGVRHPVLWFESFYNHRIQNEFPMPPANRLIGSCKMPSKGVCTDRADFARSLQNIEPSRPVMLYEVSQLYDDSTRHHHRIGSSIEKDEDRAETFRRDLQDYLQLDVPLRGKIVHVKPGRKAMSPEHQQQLDSKKINICDDEHKELRSRLQQHATESATWIESVYLKNPNVHVSSRKYFLQLLSSWHDDPCIKTSNN